MKNCLNGNGNENGNGDVSGSTYLGNGSLDEMLD